MNHKVLLIAALFATLVGCGTDRDDTPLVQGSNGVASLSGQAVVGETLSASISDSDGVLSGSESYQWFSNGDLISGATASSYTLTQGEGGEFVTVVVRYTDAAGLRETVESAPLDIQAAFALGARFVHGLVDGASCEIFAVDSSGAAASNALASGTTSDGSVSFGALVPVDGTALISCNGGTYVDEATGDTLDAPPTRAVVNVVGDAVFTVSPLTEIATQLAEAAGDLNTAVFAPENFNAAVAINFGVFEDITVIAPTDLATTAAADDAAGRYATALALISQVDANDPDASSADIIDNISTDLADGTFSQSTVDTFNVAVGDLPNSAVGGNLNNTALLVVESAINNAPEPADFDGLSATIPNDQAEALTGSVSVTDVNFGEDRVVAQTNVQTTYGTSFSIEESGAWTYTLDTANATVAGLEVGESVNDAIPLSSADGTPAILVIRITALTQVVKITDPGGDTGEIRFNLDEHLLVGKLTFSFLKEVAVGSDGNVKDAYVGLYGNENSNTETLIDLRIQGDQFESDGTTPIAPRFFARNTDSPDYPGDIVTYPFIEDEWYDVEIIWDVDAVGQEVTVVINGEVVNDGPFQTAAIVGADCGGAAGYRANCLAEGVESIQFRFGDNDRFIEFGSYFVDDIVVYDNIEGTGTPVFQDDFENSTLGTANSLYSQEVYVEIVLYDRATASEPVPTQFFDLTAVIDSDSTDVLMGTVSVVDPDPGESVLVEQMWGATEYGSFTIQPSGAWEYMLDTLNPTIAALMVGQTETDTIPISSIDGSTANVEITILGQVPLPGSDVKNKVAVIRDLRGDFPGSDPAGSDTGELRYALDSGYLAGRVEFQITRTDDSVADDAVVDPADDPNGEFGFGSADAFINLFSTSTNDATSIAKVRVKDDTFQLDYHSSCTDGMDACADVDLVDPSSGDKVLPSIDAPVLSQYNTVVMTWDYAASAVADSPVINVTIDGVAVLADYTVLNSAPGGVTHLSFRFGDNDGWLDPRAKFTVDNWKFYSDTAGTNLVASDDFQSYADGDSLDTDNPASPYASNTDNAVVEETDEGLSAVMNNVAAIRDLRGDFPGSDPAGSDTGELRYDFATEIAADPAVDGGYLAGRVEFQITRTDDSVADDAVVDPADDPNGEFGFGSADAFINLFSTSTNDATSIAKVRVKDDTFQLDYHSSCTDGMDACADVDLVDPSSGDKVLPSIDAPVLSQYNTVVMTWDYAASAVADSPVMNVTIDGVAVLADYTVLNSAPGGVTHLSFRFGDNDGWLDPRAKFTVDNWKFYSDTAGTNLVASDDFQSYTDGDSLDTDNPASPYASNTDNAVVEETDEVLSGE